MQEKRQIWKEENGKNIDLNHLVFLDESSINLAYTRLYGRARKNERVNQGVIDIRFERQSILSTIRLDGEYSPLIFEGTLNKELFSCYLETQLAPTLKKDDILVLDNCSVHTSKLVRETIQKLKLNVIFLPPYSPDFNPIELMWSKMKSFLRKQKARTFDKLIEAVNLAFKNVTKENISNWFKHCGYSSN